MLKLVSINDHPVARQWHPAESLQLNEQEEANGIAELFAFGFAIFGGGVLVGTLGTALCVWFL